MNSKRQGGHKTPSLTLYKDCQAHEIVHSIVTGGRLTGLSSYCSGVDTGSGIWVRSGVVGSTGISLDGRSSWSGVGSVFCVSRANL